MPITTERHPITFTFDLERSPTDGVGARRFRDTVARVLGFLTDRGIAGTVFVVGELAESEPGLVRDAVAGGHEVGLHGYRHVPLPELDATTLADDVRRGKHLLEDLTGRAVTGYRAPYFSLVATTPWAPDVIARAGFTYSSSVLPAANPLFGFPGAPDAPFRWPSGLVELPVPLVRLGRAALPFLGGIYLRLLPLPVVRFALARHRVDAPALWTYCHPYDFDPDEPFRVLPHLGWAQSRLLWANRRRMLAKLGRLFEQGAGEPLGVRLARGTIPAPAVAPRFAPD